MKNIIKLIIILLAVALGAGIFFGYQKIKKDFFSENPPEITTKNEKSDYENYRWVCGSLHNHIMIFDNLEQNNKSLEEVIAASKKLGLKFIMLAEKGPAYGENSPAWLNMIKECDENTSPDFVCLSGQEDCTQEQVFKKSQGHFVVIENKNYLSELLSAPDLFKQAHQQGSIVIIAHPFYKEEISDMYNYNRWDVLDDWEAIEVLNGVIDQEANEKALKKVYELWNQGIKKSITGGADFKNHKAYTDILLDPAEVEEKLKTGYTCLYLDKLNKENIIKAIKEGHGYVSSGVVIRDFNVNNAMMGEKILVEKGGSLNVKIDLKADAKINKLFLIKNGEILKKFEPGSNEFAKSFSILAEKSGWYGLEVYTDGGERAFTNAIWVEIKN